MDAAGLKETARSGKKSAMTYPHPSFDLSSAFIPPSMKELYRWCLYLYMTHSEIKPIIKKKVAYVITPFIYETKNDDAKVVWKELLETVLNIKRAEMRALLDKNVYGIAYVSIYYPFERFLVCRKCQEKTPQKNLDWMYEDHSWVATCPKCKYHGVFDSESHPIRNRMRARFIHWRPQDMEIDQNPWTGRKRYIYRIPRYLIRKIEDPKRNKMLVEDTPDELLEAVRKKMNLKLDEDKVFTFEELSPSSEDDSFPIPPLLHVFKDTWLFQTLRRAQEAISVEHILPLTLLVPSTTTSGVGAHQNYDLYTWSSQMQSIVQKWRRDPNMIYTAPFPATVENIRGDAKALDVFNDMEMLRQHIAAGLDVPIEFIIGNLQWCQSLTHGLVTTSQGQFYLDELAAKEQGPKPVQFEAPGHEEPGEAKFAHNVGVKSSVKLTFELGNEAFPSEDHRYYRMDPGTLEPGWVRADDLKLGDHVAIKPGTDCWSREVPSLVHPEESLKSSDHPLFPGKMTMDLAGLMGGLVAEGSVTGESRVNLGMNDRGVVEDLRDRADRIFGHSHTISKRESGDLSDNPSHRFEVGRVSENRFLELNIGVGYAEDKRVPSVIRRSPKEYVFEFLRYLFERDGGPTKDDVRYASKSSKLVAEVQALLMNAGILGHHYEGMSKTPAGEPVKMHHLVITGAEMVRFKELIGFVSKSKNHRLDRAIERWNSRSYDKMSIRDRVPYGREALARFVEQHRIGKLWAEDKTVPTDLPVQERFTVDEIAGFFGKSRATVHTWIRKGLKTTLAPGKFGQFSAFVVARIDLVQYIQEVGLRRRVHIDVPYYEMNRQDLRNIDLTYVQEKDPELAKNFALLASEELVWVKVTSKEAGPALPMGDLTIEGTHSYLTDGVVVHNSGGSISLRVLENLFLNTIEELTQFEQTFVLPNLRRFYRLPRIEIHHQKFKMADDVQQKQLALSLRQTNTVSDQTTREELDFDNDKETARIAKEDEERMRKMWDGGIKNARLQAETMKIQAEAQAIIQQKQMDQQAAQQAAQPQPGAVDQNGQSIPQPVLPPPNPEDQATPTKPGIPPPALLNLMAEHFMKSTPDHLKEQELMAMDETNPPLVKQIRLRMKMMDNTQKAIKALPEQKPPRRGPGQAVI